MITTLVLSALAVLFLMGLFAPFETFGWWAGWYGEKPGERELPDPDEVPQTDAAQFIVYLTGINGLNPEEYTESEQVFLKELQKRLPNMELVDDAYPYAASNLALTGERFFGWFWRRLGDMRGKGALSLITYLIHVRNIWQVLVSSDNRFGPLYNYATAQHVLVKLLEHGYPLGSSTPITLIGYSGGGQISAGAAPLLEAATQAPVHVISIGGVMSSNRNILDCDGLTHLYGSKDVVQRLGYLFFPQRWPFLRWTAWNRARRKGIIERVLTGPMIHVGAGDYMDPNTKLDTGQSYLDRTLDIITGRIEEFRSVRGTGMSVKPVGAKVYRNPQGMGQGTGQRETGVR